MKANELRIDNLIAYDDKHGFISTEKVLAINHTEWINGTKQWWVETDNLEGELLSDFQPIPLTEKWLKKFGFKKEYPDKYESDKLTLQQFGSEYQIEINDEYNVFNSIQYVHQLQNLYFALTGQELTVTVNV